MHGAPQACRLPAGRPCGWDRWGAVACHWLALTLVLPVLALAACAEDEKDLTAPPLYLVGGTISGYTSSGLKLQLNGSGTLDIDTLGIIVSGSGIFSFNKVLPDNSIYVVTVFIQPSSPTQTCTVTNDSGFIQTAEITDVMVTCV